MTAKPGLRARVAAAIVFTPLLLAAILWDGWVLGGVCTLLSTVMLWEFLHFALGYGYRLQKTIAHLACLAWSTQLLGWWSASWGSAVWPAMLISMMVVQLWSPESVERRLAHIGLMSFGVVYCGGLFPYLALLRALPHVGYAYGVMVVLCTWGSDTAAYFAGHAWGKRRLLVEISPAKTWEGAIGGIVAAVVIGWLLVPILHMTYVGAWWDATCVALLAAMLGLLGDLSESMLKRASAVKDSSGLIPGHGGVLDRFDSLLFALPGCYAYLWLHVQMHFF